MLNPDRDLVEGAMTRSLPLAVDTSRMAVEMGAQILRAAPGEITLGYLIGDAFTQATGALQGGALAAMLDFGLAFAALTLRRAGESAATLSLTINYLRPALPGAFEVRARVARSGRRVSYAEATLFDAAGHVIATATSPLLNS